MTVLANRGAAGIDGTVSTALGAALACSGGGGRPSALLGDLTLPARRNRPADSARTSRGPTSPSSWSTTTAARIFALLEQGGAEHAPAFERVFGTPHGVDIAALATAVGVPVLAPTSADDLAAVLAEKDAGLRLVHLRTDRGRVRDLARRLREAVAAAVG